MAPQVAPNGWVPSVVPQLPHRKEREELVLEKLHKAELPKLHPHQTLETQPVLPPAQAQVVPVRVRKQELLRRPDPRPHQLERPDRLLLPGPRLLVLH